MAAAVSDAVALLLTARRGGPRLTRLPDAMRPMTAADAYAIQDAIAGELGAVGGWKVGAKSATAEPTCAPLPASLIFRSPQRFIAGTFGRNGIEAELAFTLSRDLPPRPEPYRAADVAAAVSRVHAAIEIVDSRFVGPSAVDALSMLADSHGNGALVIGDGVTLPPAFDSSSQPVALDVGGARLHESRGSNPAGDVLHLLAWLANHAAPRSGGLRRGDVVTTGSWTGMRFVEPGARVEAAFADIGRVEVRF